MPLFLLIFFLHILTNANAGREGALYAGATVGGGRSHTSTERQAPRRRGGAAGRRRAQGPGEKGGTPRAGQQGGAGS